MTATVNATIADVSAEARNATANLTNATADWADQNLQEEDMHELIDDLLDEIADELDLNEREEEREGERRREPWDEKVMLLESSESNEAGSSIGLITAATIATAAGLFVARQKCHKDDNGFERV